MIAGKMFGYDLISSPMMLNEVLRKRVVDTDSLITQSNATSGYSNDRREERRTRSVDGRGHSRTATTLLDPTVTIDELDRYNTASSRTNKCQADNGMSRLLSEMRRLTPPRSPLEQLQSSLHQVSIYSGPLHNNRSMDMEGSYSMVSIADKLANARMMSKSGYTWDQNAACARIRLGDGAILQNLYPSHSHVKLLNGKIERIDVYSKRFLNDRELLKEVTLIKDYEYKQWARTKPLNEREYNQNSKPLPLERIESRYTQPSWDTLRAMNSTSTLSTRHRLFSYDDLAAKFTEPKFLKRMGFIEKESDFYKQTKENQQKESEKEHDMEQRSSTAPEPTNITEEEDDEPNYIDDDGLSSDDEEYHQPEPEIQTVTQPERIPSSLRSSRQQLVIYRDDGVIGSKSTVNRQNANNELEPIEKPPDTSNKEKKKKKRTQSLKKPAASVATLNIQQEGYSDITNDDATSKQNNVYPAKSVRRSKSYKLDISTNNKHRRFIPFSQPVCLCPKLSQETLASFYSPMMQHYFASNPGSKTGYMTCKLHGPNARDKDDTVLKSL